MLARRSVVVVANSLLGAALGYVGLFAMARFMGAEVVGGRAYALALVLLLGTMARLGFPTTHARRLGRGEDVARSIGTYALLKMALTLTFAAVAVLAAWIWFGVLDHPFTDLTATALWIALAAVVTRSLRDIFVNTFRGLHLTAEREGVLLVNTVITVALTALAAIAFAWSHGRWSPLPGLSSAVARFMRVDAPVAFEEGLAWVLGAYLAGEVAALALAIWLFLRARIEVARPDRSIARDYFRATLPLMMVSVGAVLLKRVDQVMIGFWFDPFELGQYEAAMKLSDLLLILAFGIEVTLLPLISRLDREGDNVAMLAVVRQAERWISLMIWPVIAYALLAARPIMHILLSDDFLAAAPVFIVLCLYAFFQSMRIPLKTKVIGMGMHGYAARVAASALAINILLNLVFIPPSLGPVPMLGLGAMGAAVTTLLTGIYMFVAFRFRMRRETGHPLVHAPLVKHPLAAAVAGALVWAGMRTGLLPALLRFYDLIWFAILVTSLYLGALWLLREFGPDDVGAVRAMLRGQPTTAKRQG